MMQTVAKYRTAKFNYISTNEDLIYLRHFYFLVIIRMTLMHVKNTTKNYILEKIKNISFMFL